MHGFYKRILNPSIPPLSLCHIHFTYHKAINNWVNNIIASNIHQISYNFSPTRQNSLLFLSKLSGFLSQSSLSQLSVPSFCSVSAWSRACHRDVTVWLAFSIMMFLVGFLAKSPSTHPTLWSAVEGHDQLCLLCSWGKWCSKCLTSVKQNSV